MLIIPTVVTLSQGIIIGVCGDVTMGVGVGVAPSQFLTKKSLAPGSAIK